MYPVACTLGFNELHGILFTFLHIGNSSALQMRFGQRAPAPYPKIIVAAQSGGPSLGPSVCTRLTHLPPSRRKMTKLTSFPLMPVHFGYAHTFPTGSAAVFINTDLSADAVKAANVEFCSVFPCIFY